MKLPGPSEDDEIHPGDSVVLTEGDPYYVGNHPIISDAFRLGLRGRVLKRLWKVLDEKESRALGKTGEYEVAVVFPGTSKPFYFWQMFLKKIRYETPNGERR